MLCLSLEGLCSCRIEAVCVLGTPLCTDVYGAAPADAVSFSVKHTDGVRVEVVTNDQTEVIPANGAKRWPLDKGTTLRLSMSKASTEVNDNKVKEGWGHDLTGSLAFLGISLDVDADRDGVVEKNNPRKATWTWGPDGQGAILLVNCDKDNPLISMLDCEDERVFSKEDLLDMAPMVLRTEGPQRLPPGYEMVLYIPVSDSDKVGVFYVQNPFFGHRYIHVLGRRKLYHSVKYTGGSAELEFFVEGLRFPDESFNGLVSISVSLLGSYRDIQLHSRVNRLHPWVAQCSNAREPFVLIDNYLFLKEVKNLVSKASCDMKVCFGYMNRGDRWMQDEIEFGYIHAPHKGFPVVLDSPRDGGLKEFPIKELLGPDFGYVTREPLFEVVTSLDSFGNLEVSPPVTVNGKEYPLGRILIGSSFPTSAGRRMTKVVRDFLYAQRVQAPIELYSDWLTVGHVDEFVTFVPIPGKKQFRMLMASTSACYKLFQEKQREGHGEATMFKGYSGTDTKRVTINKVLSNEVMMEESHYVQRCIDWNRDILKKELGLKEKDIIDLPALFKIDRNGKAMAYFPNMVNMIVLSRDLGVPKPFGPIIEGECCLEEHVRSLLEPLGLRCSFIDDISSYHKMLGEVHCGTNVHRQPFSYKWWNVIP
uniref:protein-arginine deiminase n=1 Tax=Crocodylus porosus TaxID=8502 RepID=A0A7M4FHL8_CROPO